MTVLNRVLVFRSRKNAVIPTMDGEVKVKARLRWS